MSDATGNAATRSVNDLPEEILIHILSFLPTKSAIQTSLLSRKWRNLWCQLPSLLFSYYPTFTSSRTFSDFVHQTLLRRLPSSSPLRSFYVEFPFRDPLYSSQVDTWLRYAISHGVHELKLDFFISSQFQSENFLESDLVYDFPFFMLTNGCVKVLRLIKCDIILPSAMASLALKSLGSIFLDQVYLSDIVLSDMISGCVNLDCLSLEYCFGMKDVKICSLKLKRLHLNYFINNSGSVHISCPSLASLEMIGFEVANYDFRELSALTEGSVFFLHKLEYYEHWSKVVRSLLHVKRLAIQNWWFKLFAAEPAFSRSSLKTLKHLELRTVYSKPDLLGIAALLALSPNVETLILDYLCKIDDDESFSEEILNKPIDLILPSLKQVKVNDFRASENVTLLLTLLILHGEVLEKIILVPPVLGETIVCPTVLHRRLKKMKFSLGQVPKLKFKDEGGAIGIFMEE